MNTEPFVINPLLASIRKDFLKGALTEESTSSDPITQFETWLKAAYAEGNEMANAMVLSTVDSSGAPSSRVMLLRDISFGGFTFFTNYESKKGSDIKFNNKASLLFFWHEQERQVRVQGIIKKLPSNESDVYFFSRPFESQVGAWTSKQSTEIKDRAELEKKYDEQLAKYKNQQVPRPEYWGGFVLEPLSIELWQGRANRLHDRIEFIKNADNLWDRRRLMP